MKKIAPETVDLLRRSTLSSDGLSLTIPETDRKSYVLLTKVLEVYEGKWNRKEKAVIFPRSFAAKKAELCETGELSDKKNPLDFFYTPDPVLDLLFQHCDGQPRPDMRVLEPSAGQGHIAQYLRREYEVNPDCIELDPHRRQTLEDTGFPVVGTDFLEFDPGDGYDFIIMNPPFRTETDKNAYITHIMYAHSCLREGGQLLAIVPEGFFFRQDAKVSEFREFVKANGIIGEQVPADSFKAAGTGIVTRVIQLVA